MELSVGTDPRKAQLSQGERVIGGHRMCDMSAKPPSPVAVS